MSSNNIHDEWLSLVEISGPFLAPPVLNEVFPQGLDLLEPSKHKRLRQTYEEWREALEAEDPEFAKLHQAWIKEVISNCLSFNEDSKGAHLKFGAAMPPTLVVQIPEQGVSLAPEYALVDEQHDNKPLLLIQSYASGVDLQVAMSTDGWSATPADRMVQLCRLTGCRLGLVTNGERWMLVDAPVGAVTTFASWYARLWIQEPITLQAFVHLLGIRRFFVAAGEQIPALIDKSLQHQDEVTTALGEQVQRAVEVLIQSLDRADQDRNRELLKDVTPAELYEAGLTLMMRLVFLLSAEERGLLLMGDECYEENYAISTLRMQLRSESEEILERRWDAWSRLLSVFRAVYGGIDHENMRLPALGGSLFDPDRFAFLEGRAKGSDWRKDLAKPLPIDNRTVLLLLDAIQQYQGRSLSYRALDVEQIGYVYEGLLERTVKRTSEVILDVGATRSAEKPLVSLAELISLKQSSESALLDCLVERTGSSITRVKNALAKPIDDQLSDRLLSACMGNIDLLNQIKPFSNLLRIDPWGYPLVYPANSFVVALGSDRRETGSHYTPKSLTETIVAETLTPVVYVGPAEGLDRHEWKLKTPEEILQLKICDPAMGSGAFLVQVCRFLSDKLIEAWRLSEIRGATISSDGDVVEIGSISELMPVDLESRTVIAKRLIAERCLYGVDINPLAVELAKLSIWLMTLAKSRPFGFLDHNLRSGDTLLGLHHLDQLVNLSFDSIGISQKRLFAQNINKAVDEAIAIRKQLRSMPIRDVRDVQNMSNLDHKARATLKTPELIADAFIGEVLISGGSKAKLLECVEDLAIRAGEAIAFNLEAIEKISSRMKFALSDNPISKKMVRKPFHWPLEFPEVFSGNAIGFDAIVGNPPFLGNRLWKGALGDALQWQCQMVLGAPPGKIDLCVVFHRRSLNLLKEGGCYGMLATNSITEGMAIEVGLSVIERSGSFYYTKVGMPWPGSASISIALICFFKGQWKGKRLADESLCDYIDCRLQPGLLGSWQPKVLSRFNLFVYQGVDNSKGLKFLVTNQDEWFKALRNEKDSLLRPYITGEDIADKPPSFVPRWALNLFDKNLEEISTQWPIAYDFLISVVKPERTPEALKSYKGLINRWWQFWNSRNEQSKKLLSYSQSCLVIPKVTMTLFGSLRASNVIYTNKVIVIGLTRPDLPAICISSIFRLWISDQCLASLGKVVCYVLTVEGLSTFPLPESLDADLNGHLGIEFFKLMDEWESENNKGLREFVHAIDDESYIDPKIIKMRNLIIQIDENLLLSYGWEDIRLEHGFYEAFRAPQNIQKQFSISPLSRAEIMHRLLMLNKKYYEDGDLKSLKHSSKTKKIPKAMSLKNMNSQQSINFEAD